jgi:hypothetical protein
VVLSTWKFSFPIRTALVVFALTALSGCGGRIPVSGKVTVDDKPLKSGGVTFVPDTEKGNNSTVNAIGQIKEDGTYELFTEGKPGVAPGWYKVLIAAAANPIDNSGAATTDGKKLYAPPQSLVHDKYSKLKATDLSFEVKSGGSYDLKLSGPQNLPAQPGVPAMPGVPAQPGIPPMPR